MGQATVVVTMCDYLWIDICFGVGSDWKIFS